jgi:hypothetical protein
MEIEPLTNLYTEMLATAHDIGYVVPDALLVETENPDELRKVIEPLDTGIKEFFAEAKKTEAAKPPKEKKAKKAPTKPAKAAAQKDVSKETNMATATAKKVAAPKKAAAKKAPAKKAKAGKKASAANARTPTGPRFTGDEKITVSSAVLKENPARKGTGKFDRMANLIKHNGKTVAAFLKSSLGKSGTLRNAAAKGWITVK